MSVTGHAAATKIGQGSRASRRGRSRGGVIGILQIAGIRAGDLRDSTVLFGAHPCPTIATAVQPGMFRSTKINQLQSRSRYGTRGLLGVFAFAMRRSRVRSPSAPPLNSSVS